MSLHVPLLKAYIDPELLGALVLEQLAAWTAPRSVFD